MNPLLSTKEVSQLLNVNEKMVYTLVSEKGLPATKITGKWLFPRHLVQQWIETNTINYPESATHLPPYGNLGSMGGLQALRQNFCHMAASHLIQDDEEEYNFDYAFKELEQMPAVVNFCKREQGILVKKSNPKKISSVADLAQPDITIVNRPLGTGTRLLLDRELKKAGLRGEKLKGYSHEINRHLDVGLEILAGRADAGPAIRAVASLAVSPDC
jgi:excisionase family DNA binding protein